MKTKKVKFRKPKPFFLTRILDFLLCCYSEKNELQEINIEYRTI